MRRPPVPDSLAGERGAGDLPAVPAGRRGGTSASAEREFRCISRRGNPCRTGAADGPSVPNPGTDRRGASDQHTAAGVTQNFPLDVGGNDINKLGAVSVNPAILTRSGRFVCHAQRTTVRMFRSTLEGWHRVCRATTS